MDDRNQGYLFGLAGVLVFSGSLPATRAAVTGFDPLFLTAARATIAAAPVMLLVALASFPPALGDIGAAAWTGLAYVSLFSMLIGFVFWYRGLALGGTASVGQLQLLQPLLGFALAALLLHEPVGWPLLAVTGGVLLCVAGARRSA